MSDLLKGELVCLCAENPEVRAALFTRWNQDSEMQRLLDSEPPRLMSEKKWKEWLEKGLELEGVNEKFFSIRLPGQEKMIGFIGLFDLYMQHGDALVAIALGEREYWGKGYGTDAMRILLKYSFQELNLRRVGLIVFEYNARAMRSYEKAGFVYEGRLRRMMLRDGKRWDWVYMGILREEWQALQSTQAAN